jgi:hypothetical protein
MEIGGVVYRPEVEPEHIPGIFKDFTESELSRNDAGRTSEEEEMKCPLCQRIFVTEKELVEHCAACDGEETR